MDKEDVVYIFVCVYVCVCIYIYIMEYYSAIKKNEILSFAMTWKELESTLLSEISHSEEGKCHTILLRCEI